MQRILVIGCSGAGKSTFARGLALRTGLPLVSLDAEFWQPGWKSTPKAEWRDKVARLAAADAWIMDGNYNASLDLRLPRADTVIWFRLPRWRCICRAVLRSWRSYGKVRPEMAPGCPERFDPGFYRYIWNFDRDETPANEAALARYGQHLRPVIIRRDADAMSILDIEDESKLKSP